jgi:cytoskeletal protein CcmA (bactofilin family)
MATAPRTVPTGGTGDPAAIISAEAEFSGRMEAKDLNVLGRFDGDLKLSGRLRVGAQARVKARVQASAVDINGEFEGEVRAQTLSFGETARAKGIFLSDRVSMKDGAQVNGAFNLEGKS